MDHDTFNCGEGQGGGRPGEKGAGGVREAGEEGAGSGIPKVAGSRRRREKLCNIAQYFAIEKMQRGGSQKIQSGNRDYRVREAGGSNPPVPPPPLTGLPNHPFWRISRSFNDFVKNVSAISTLIPYLTKERKCKILKNLTHGRLQYP